MPPLIFPEPPETPTCTLLLVPNELVPIVGALFGRLERRAEWLTDSDYQSGYKAFTQLEAQLMNSCLTDLIQEIRDARGVLPDFVSTPIEERTSDMYSSLQLVRQEVFDTRGTLVDGWFTDTIATTADVVRAARGSDSDTGATIWSDISDLLSTGAELASIVGFITNLLTSQEETVVEGGLGIAQIALLASIAGILQTMGLTQSLHTEALIAILNALRGPTAVEDNIIVALRGTTPANEFRNVATLLGEEETE